jgi:glutamate 5-kinase
VATLGAQSSVGDILGQAKRVVVKAGSSLLSEAQSGALRHGWMASLAQDLAQLRDSGAEVLMVSSGAVALGRRALKLSDGALALEQKQAAAAVGQPMLASAWKEAFAPLGIVTAQALLTLEDTEQRRRWLNSRATLEALLSMGAMAVVNENDTVATDEIRYGDNDRLAARVAQMSGADVLVLLSDIDGLWTADPHRHTDASPIPFVADMNAEIMAMAEGPNPQSNQGSGGMVTKLLAARMAVHGGCTVILASGVCDHPLAALMDGARATVFAPSAAIIDARKGWIAGTIKPAGQVHIDEGAVRALGKGASLLPAGMTACTGDFTRGDVLAILDMNGKEVGRGLASYKAGDARKICGLRSEDIAHVLGYSARAAMIHRDNLVLLHKEKT